MQPVGSLWEETAVPHNGLSEDVADADCDVAIVGAGFTGLRAALCLAEKGVRAVVLDAQDVGWGASGRNGGQVNPMLPVARPEHLRKAVGDAYFERLAEVSLNSADELFSLVRNYDIPCDARQKGWLRADHGPVARDTAREAATAWNAFGAGFEFVDGEELRRLTGSPAYESGVLSPKGGAVQPLSLVRGLAKAARKAGAQILPECADLGGGPIRPRVDLARRTETDSCPVRRARDEWLHRWAGAWAGSVHSSALPGPDRHGSVERR